MRNNQTWASSSFCLWRQRILGDLLPRSRSWGPSRRPRQGCRSSLPPNRCCSSWTPFPTPLSPSGASPRCTSETGLRDLRFPLKKRRLRQKMEEAARSHTDYSHGQNKTKAASPSFSLKRRARAVSQGYFASSHQTHVDTSLADHSKTLPEALQRRPTALDSVIARALRTQIRAQRLIASHTSARMIIQKQLHVQSVRCLFF